MILSDLKNYARHVRPVSSLSFSRPVVLFQSDDWGLVGIRDQEGFDRLCSCGLDLGKEPYDFYSLETAQDLHSLFEVMRRHRDSVGRPPCFTFNFVLSNVDFAKAVGSQFKQLELLPIDQGFPGRWDRPGLLRAYREGAEQGLIYPAFHGLTHFSRRSAERVMRGDGEKTGFLRMLYESDTPLLHTRMPWIEFEYRDTSNGNSSGWLEKSAQRASISEGKKIFERMFGRTPFSACAPGYRANDNTWQSWAEEGIVVAQNGPGLNLGPHFDKRGLLHLYRNVPFEPALDAGRYDEQVAIGRADEAITAGRPAIVCMHSVNFHSTLKDFRDLTLRRLDGFLTLLERKYNDLLYVNDHDVLSIAMKNEMEWKGLKLKVNVTRRIQPSPALMHYWGRIRRRPSFQVEAG